MKKVFGRWHTCRTVAGQCGYSSGKFASELGVCPRHLRRQIRLRFGVSMGDWIKEQRLLAAADELRVIRVVKLVALLLDFQACHSSPANFVIGFASHPARS